MKHSAKLANRRDAAPYREQNRFYTRAYRSGVTPWSYDHKPSPSLVAYLPKTGLKKGVALDLGCGEGRHTRYLAKKGIKTIGAELQREALKTAVRGKGKKELYLQTDIFQPPFTPGSFDLVLDYGVFHHIRRRDTAAYLAFLRGMLKPGGWLILQAFSRNFTHADGKRYPRGFVVHKGHYDRFSTKREIRGIFSPFFRVEDIHEDKENFLNALFHLKS